MPDGRYELIGLIPASSDFTPERAVRHYSWLRFTQYLRGEPVFLDEPVRAELLSGGLAPYSTGFRVWYGPWSVEAWLDVSADAVQDNHDRSEEPGLPAPPEVIATCPARLSIRSDVDAPGYENSDRFTEYTDQLRMRFGVFLLDFVNGGWWT